MNKNFFPININIADGKILIIGGGKNALKKVQQLNRFNARIEIVALHVIDEIRQYGHPFRIKAYDPSDLDGFLMVYSCTNNQVLDNQIADDACERRILVNVHDNPSLCQFVSPAIYKNKNITISVGSNAEDVNESIRLRNLIQEFLESNQIIKLKI